jgi:hypothetical protein
MTDCPTCTALRAEVEKWKNKAEAGEEVAILQGGRLGIMSVERDRLRAEVEKLRAALRWYADEANYEPRASAFGDGVYAPRVINDKGWNARAALQQETSNG